MAGVQKSDTKQFISKFRSSSGARKMLIEHLIEIIVQKRVNCNVIYCTLYDLDHKEELQFQRSND